MRAMEDNDPAKGSAIKGRNCLAVAAAVALTGCSASLPGGSFVSGGVGEPGQHFGQRVTAAAEAKGQVAATESASGHQSKAAAAAATPSNSASVPELARAHASDPRNPQAALAYARALKREGKRREALAVLDTVGDAEPRHPQVRLERGLLTLELGQTAQAETLLKLAATGPEADWRAHSGLGVAASSQGRQKEAQAHFSKALSISPNNPAVLNNMAVSLLLDRKVDQAEALLRRASTASGPAPQQVKQNLALARGLRADGADRGVSSQ